jgi:phosphatidylserine/phosphatidylglycerophosphate/cardiolipin synthase-like enzyme
MMRSTEEPGDCQQEGEPIESMAHGLAAGKCLSLWYDRKISKADRTMASQVERLVDSARFEVCIESPYPAFSRAFSACLRRAARRGVRVTILTNSISSTDQILTHAAYQNQKAIWLGYGVQLFEYNGPDHLHSKKMVVDNCIAWIGSYNFDARSERLNLELALQVTDPEFVNALSGSMWQRQSSSTRVCKAGRENIRPASFRDRAKMRLFQAWMPILRPQL